MDQTWIQLATPFGITLVVVGILFFIVKYFVAEMRENRKDSKELTEKFITLSEQNIKTHAELKSSIDANTRITKESMEASKLSSDNLTALVLKVATSSK